METFSIWTVLLIVVMVLPVWFFALTAKKAGYAPWWALLGLVPLINVIALYLFAYKEWPALSSRLASSETVTKAT
jgi:uncharacterized membrane protein